jgi:hypothetical protein
MLCIVTPRALALGPTLLHLLYASKPVPLRPSSPSFYLLPTGAAPDHLISVLLHAELCGPWVHFGYFSDGGRLVDLFQMVPHSSSITPTNFLWIHHHLNKAAFVPTQGVAQAPVYPFQGYFLSHFHPIPAHVPFLA